MDFEEIQVIWNKQDNQPIFNINPDTVMTGLQNETRAIHSSNVWIDLFYMITAGFNVIGAYFNIRSGEHIYVEILFGLFSFSVGAGFLISFLKRRNETLDLDQSIREILESVVAKYRTSNQIAWRGILIVILPSIAREAYRAITLSESDSIDWPYPGLVGFSVVTIALILAIRHQSRRIEKLLSFRRQLD